MSTRIDPKYLALLWVAFTFDLLVKIVLLPFQLLLRLFRPRRSDRGGW